MTELEKIFIKAIEKVKQEPCEDAISREDRLIDLLNAIESDDSDYWTNKRISAALRNISSVTQKSGKWIAQDIHNCHTDFKCSECGYIHSFMHLYGEPTADYTYCPNCGAKMESEENE